MTMSTSHKGRTTLFPHKSFFSRIGRRLSAAHPGALWHLPAFLLACSPEPVQETLPPAPAQKVQIYLLQSANTSLQGLELLFFQEGPLEKLDAYQHFGTISGSVVQGVSSTAARKAVAFSNCPEDIYQWSDIRSYASLQDRRFHLEDENPERPRLLGACDLPEGNRRNGRILLQPMLTRITLRSVACDFTGHAYAGEPLRNVRAYLTYVSRETRPLAPDDHPVSWLNAGHLDETETGALPHPELVLAPVSSALSSRIYPSLDFYCYPNPYDGKVFGEPVTRLVLEGQLRGKTYYYPIDLPGLQAHTQYRMDVTLTRAGTTDPDTPALTGTILLENQVLDWDEREWEDIHYQ